MSTLDCLQFENTKWCTNGECEYRHLSQSEKELRQSKVGKTLKQYPFLNEFDESKLIIAAGPERSGSTWLYNAIRLLFLHSNQCIDSYWIHAVTKDKIVKRLQASNTMDQDSKQNEQCQHLLIKTHQYPFTDNNKLSDILNLKPIIIITHRNLNNVILSYQRVGWSSSLPYNYVSDHLKWQKITSLDLGFEDMMKDQVNALNIIAQHIGLLKQDIKDDKLSKQWVNHVLIELNNLKAPINKYGPDNITKLWPSHIGSKTTSSDNKLDKKTQQEIAEKYGEFIKLYGYDQL